LLVGTCEHFNLFVEQSSIREARGWEFCLPIHRLVVGGADRGVIWRFFNVRLTARSRALA
jgi:hypothetical protein